MLLLTDLTETLIIKSRWLLQVVFWADVAARLVRADYSLLLSGAAAAVPLSTLLRPAQVALRSRAVRLAAARVWSSIAGVRLASRSVAMELLAWVAVATIVLYALGVIIGAGHNGGAGSAWVSPSLLQAALGSALPWRNGAAALFATSDVAGVAAQVASVRTTTHSCRP